MTQTSAGGTLGSNSAFCSTYSVLDYYELIERLDQGHLHPLLEHPRQTCPCWGLNEQPPAPLTGTLAKSYLNSLIIANRNLYTLYYCFLFGTSIPPSMCSWISL